jgi:O-antigen/teichoic acid export membrane protein
MPSGGPSRSVGANTVASAIGALTTIGTSVLLLPIVLARIGLEAYGIWALGLLVVTYATTAGMGLAPTVARYVAVADGANDRAQIRRLFWGATAVYGVLGIGISGAVALFAPTLVSAFSVPHRLRGEAEVMVRLLAIAAAVALYAGCLGTFLQGLRRYVISTMTGVIASAAFFVVVASGLTRSQGIEFLALAFVSSQGLLMVLRLVALWEIIFSGLPTLPDRSEARMLAWFTVRMQVLPMSTLINNQSDRLVIGLIATPPVVGEYAIGAQVALAVTMLVGTLIGPMGAEFAHGYGTGAIEAVYGRYIDFQNRFIRLVCGISALACAGFGSLLIVWLQRRTGDASVFGVLTLLALAINMTTGPATAYLRSIGKPSLEAQYQLGIIGANIVLTVICGVVFGPLGVVGATLAAYASGSGWFYRRLDSYVAGGIEEVRGSIARGITLP